MRTTACRTPDCALTLDRDESGDIPPIGAFAVSFLPIALVNAIQVPFLGEIVLLAALVLSGVARFALAVLAGLLFLAGEVFIGHDERQAG